MRLIVVLPVVILLSAALPACGPAQPEAQFTASNTTGDVPMDVQFADLSEGDIDAWEWDFDDDGQVDSTLQNPQHTYNDPGGYTVTLRVSGPDGNDVESKLAYLDFSPPPCRADFVAEPTEVGGMTEVQFSDLSSGEITTCAWDFDGDGTIDSTERNPTHTYEKDGVYSVSLTVRGPYSEHKLTRTDYIEVLTIPQCRAEFIAEPTTGEGATDVQFSWLSTGDVDSWSWDFNGDGTIDSTEQNPTYIYGEDGVYTVSLTVTGPDCEDTLTRIGYIKITGCST